MSDVADMPAVPDEVPISEARAIIGDLVDAASKGKIVYLTRRGQRVAAIVPADEKMTVNEPALAVVDDFIAKHNALFERLADA